jgi:uncharacterized protein
VPVPDLTADAIVDLLDLVPLPEEGGFYRRTHHDGRSTAIYFLMTPGEFSAMHRLGGPELWHFYAGDPATMLLLHADGAVTEPVLGTDLRAGERPQVMVPAGVCMGASTGGAWTLLGTTMAPPFTDVTLEFPPLASLLEGWPSAATRIRSLTRSDGG